jgi:hypothetical protein
MRTRRRSQSGNSRCMTQHECETRRGLTELQGEPQCAVLVKRNMYSMANYSQFNVKITCDAQFQPFIKPFIQ